PTARTSVARASETVGASVWNVKCGTLGSTQRITRLPIYCVYQNDLGRSSAAGSKKTSRNRAPESAWMVCSLRVPARDDPGRTITTERARQRRVDWLDHAAPLARCLRGVGTNGYLRR